MNANGRRARQAKNKYKHLARLGGNRCSARPIYPSHGQRTVAEAIAAERRAAAKAAAAKGKKKK